MEFLKPARRENGVYLNPVPTEMGVSRHMGELIRRMLFGKEERVPRKPIGPFRTDTSVFAQPPASGLRITWLGHSILLMEIDGTTILTDPVFSQRVSMVQWAGPKRFFPPPLSMAELPKLDAILLSHDHYDHLDKDAVLQLQERTPLFVCSMGVGALLQKWGIHAAKIHEMQWTDSFTVPSASSTPLTITALPARHFSGRGFKRFEALWSSFVLKTDRHNIYHGADSGYWPGYREIGETYGPFDLAMLEIGAFDELWNQIHLGPDNAMKAVADLHAKALMPIHWGLFSLAFHAWFQPPERMTRLAAEAGLPLWMPEPGAPTEFAGEARNSLWWRRYLSESVQSNALEEALSS